MARCSMFIRFRHIVFSVFVYVRHFWVEFEKCILFLAPMTQWDGVVDFSLGVSGSFRCVVHRIFRGDAHMFYFHVENPVLPIFHSYSMKNL